MACPCTRSPFFERYFDIVACTIADVFRLLTGNLVAKGELEKPEQALVLYEFEGALDNHSQHLLS